MVCLPVFNVHRIQTLMMKRSSSMLLQPVLSVQPVLTMTTATITSRIMIPKPVVGVLHLAIASRY